MPSNAAQKLHHLRRWADASLVCAIILLVAATGQHVFAQEKNKPESAIVATPGVIKATNTSPEWSTLDTSAQTALKPLQPNWSTMSEGQKRKWIELSKNYAKLPPGEQTKLHARMSDWAALSPQQRTAARLNFAENRALTDGLTAEQRKVQWEAYQLLSPEEKRKLAASSEKPLVGTATAVKPAQPIRQSPPPQFGTAKALASTEKKPTHSGKVHIAPQLQTSNSLVPQKFASDTAPETSKQ